MKKQDMLANQFTQKDPVELGVQIASCLSRGKSFQCNESKSFYTTVQGVSSINFFSCCLQFLSELLVLQTAVPYHILHGRQLWILQMLRMFHVVTVVCICSIIIFAV